MKTFNGYIQLRQSKNNPRKKSANRGKGKDLSYVNGCEGAWNGVSCYVWAENANDAKIRVKAAIDQWLTENQKKRRHIAKPNLLKMKFTAERIPQGMILNAGSCWAGNSGFF